MDNINPFIDIFDKIFKLSRSIAPIYSERRITVDTGKGLFGHKKETKVELVDVRKEDIETILKEVDNIFQKTYYESHTSIRCREPVYRVPMKFETLWFFGEFIEYIDSVIFYPNEESNRLFVDYKREDPNVVTIRLKEKDYYEIRIDLQMIVESRYDNNLIKIMKVMVIKDWDIDNIQKYTITSGTLEYIGDDHKADMMMRNLSDLIYDECYNIFAKVLNTMTERFDVRIPVNE